MRTRVIAAGTVLMLLGVAAVGAFPPTPTRTPVPVGRDSAAGPPPEAGLSDATAQYNAIAASIGAVQKTIADLTADIASLHAKIEQINKQIEQLRQLQDKVNRVSAGLAAKEQKANAAKLSKKISEQEVRAQELRASLILRLTPAPKKPTPKP